jgi:YD repeat-containing protein
MAQGQAENAYDPAGNRLLQETHNSANLYVYDATNRLTTLSDQGALYAYAYNGLGDRLRQRGAYIHRSNGIERTSSRLSLTPTITTNDMR